MIPNQMAGPLSGHKEAWIFSVLLMGRASWRQSFHLVLSLFSSCSTVQAHAEVQAVRLCDRGANDDLFRIREE